LREAMKENGIGRPSTRAAIIETLFRRRYIFRERKNIVATKAGIELIATIDEELLKSAKLTGLWENKLRRIERGQYSASEFIGELKQMIASIVLNVLTDNTQRRIVIEADSPASDQTKGKRAKASSEKREPAARKPRTPAPKTIEQIVCPECGEGHLVKGRTAYGCSRYREGCPLRLSFDEYPDSLTPPQLSRKLKKRKS
ncbi:MAG: DNA topoisomerase III, partial [Muribaculaceae bacterium]|nr:DNA topoisomerase III [Muribaculaceae bacterium]